MMERLLALFVSIQNFEIRDEEGQTAVEYALVLALIAVVLVVALASGLSGSLSTAIGKITSALGA